ncbi:heme ABC exporter ATP-binding protein CcmA [Novosphingobium terrae]|uniref:heme ABC exporter ATP-binding protein CcmA n=1 Tax=Novosphingobium terrae TaxID=2726189 RepID=UPI00197D9AFD|nr:heme ABC exporter ATP-binding protein CcmA [Novosphingobium terrae]
MQTAALIAWELSCRRGDRWLFHGLDLRLEQGEALHLTGPNGAGKTSLMRMLAGLLRPSPSLSPRDPAKAGSIAWEGTIALADERPALDPAQPLGKALAFWRGIDGPRDLPLERLGLDTLLDVPVRYLSTGQKKRAALARLIGQNAQNWLLDEPLNGLDVAGVALIEELVAEHCAQGGSAIVTSHQPIRLPGEKRLNIADYAL